MAPAPIRKAVIPAAGLGTRFLPATKAVPKELLPIVDTPTIQYIVAEAVAAGVRDVIIVNAKGKETIVDHFDVAKELEAHLAKTGKTALRDEIRSIAKMANVVSIRQQEPLGLGHAVLCAKDLVGDEPFVVMLGDDIIDAAVPGAKQLAACWARHGLGTIALMEVPREETHLYGIAAGQPLDDRTLRIERLVEKPKRDPPSNLAVIGRYVLPPRIFEILERVEPGVGGELQLTDALAVLAREEGLLGYRFEGDRYDAGDRFGYLKANVAFALKRPDLRQPLLAWLREVVQ
ncbi:UTP--glucose-1-phosphate uridylyltransferase GalU [Anaeromyxobacter diazotrophicus]|uniref:UTP--glucose-1-phosphate uridylyltransferase n=1 Tax=Anaeromyxobacter diazotrophicus TaxID=2590199 RepID=A0A7I9VKP2_9BACT|nr:UTP--glucose-1-phosphate uridylyltransferase GalU [Anaeromyxobacter diazotrophicus]GEJ56973.1 UTP--glucose-1-phosphate uridylyltransferase [Anaeromyxobacter diazotrophicus]